jgi:hypothetical protein
MLVLVTPDSYELDKKYYDRHKIRPIENVTPYKISDGYILIKNGKSKIFTGGHSYKLLSNKTVHPTEWIIKRVRFEDNKLLPVVFNPARE